MELRNLASVAENYRSAGAELLVMTGVIEHRTDLRDYEQAVGGTVTIVRLRVDPEVVTDRLRHRHRNDPAGLAWHLARAPGLTAILDRAGVAAAEVDTTGRLVSDIAADVVAAIGW